MISKKQIVEVFHTIKHNTLYVDRGRRIYEFEASLVYRVSFRTAKATQRNPVSENQKKKGSLTALTQGDHSAENPSSFPCALVLLCPWSNTVNSLLHVGHQQCAALRPLSTTRWVVTPRSCLLSDIYNLLVSTLVSTACGLSA